MKGMLGADLGGSAIKLIFHRNDGTLQTQTWSKAIRTEHELTEVIAAFLKQADIAAEDIEGIALTGVGSSFIRTAILGKTPMLIVNPSDRNRRAETFTETGHPCGQYGDWNCLCPRG